MSKYFKVIETSCFPCSWKVVPRDGRFESNELGLFHRTSEGAEKKANEMDDVVTANRVRIDKEVQVASTANKAMNGEQNRRQQFS